MSGLSTRARIIAAAGLAALALVVLLAFSAIDRYNADRARAETRAANRAGLIATLLAESDASTPPSAGRLGELLVLGTRTTGTAAVIYTDRRETVRAGAAAAGPPARDSDIAAALRRRAGVVSAAGGDGVLRVWGFKRVGRGAADARLWRARRRRVRAGPLGAAA